MTQDLNNKVALITGSSRGIGKAIALHLAGRGASIVVNYVRNDEAALATVEELKSLGIKALPFQANVKELPEVKAMVEFTQQELGGLDILVHNAAMGAFKPLHKLKINQWDLSLDINAKAFLMLAQQATPFMEEKKSGCMIAISSLGGQRYIPDYGAIGISKSALENLVRYLGAELAPKGIRVNCVSGGPIETDALKTFTKFQELKQEVINKTPAGRIGTPEDIAKVVGFLASEDAAWIQGQTLIADGGLSLS